MQTKIEQEQLAYQNLEQMINEMLGGLQSDLTPVRAGLNPTWKKFEEILSGNLVCLFPSSTIKL